MQIAKERTVREIAVENPESIGVFETLGIDYCCGGNRPLRDACAGAIVDVDRVIEMLAQAARNSDTLQSEEWNKREMRELMAHIVERHHDRVRQEAPRLEGLAAKVSAQHGAAHPEVLEIEQLFKALGQELSTHMLKEEQILFPYIQRMEQAHLGKRPLPPAFFGTVKRPIANMVADHDDAGALLTRMRELSKGYTTPADACPAFRALYDGLAEFERDLHCHVHLENNILFPRAVAVEESHGNGQ